MSFYSGTRLRRLIGSRRPLGGEREISLTSTMRVTFEKYDAMAKLSTLKASKHQRNKHPQEQIERLAKIMLTHGVRHPISVSKLSGEVCFGHGRWAAAKLNGWKTFPVVYQDFKDDQEEYACVQSDNGIALWAELDLTAINSDLLNLGPEFDLDLLGIKGLEVQPPEDADSEAEYGHFAEEYSPNEGVKQIIMAFEKSEYEAILPKLKAGMSKSDSPTVKDMFVHLLLNYVG